MNIIPTRSLFTTFVKTLIHKTCGDYFAEKIRSSQIDINGHIFAFQLKNLVLNTYTINNLLRDVPLELTSGTIALVKAALTKPEGLEGSKVEVSGVRLVFKPRKKEIRSWGLDSGFDGAVLASKGSQHSSAIGPIREEEDFTDFLDQIARNLQHVTLTDLEIVIEYPSIALSRDVTLSITIPHLVYCDVTDAQQQPAPHVSTSTTSENSSSPTVLYKLIKLEAIEASLEDHEQDESQVDGVQKKRKGSGKKRKIVVLGVSSKKETSNKRDKPEKMKGDATDGGAGSNENSNEGVVLNLRVRNIDRSDTIPGLEVECTAKHLRIIATPEDLVLLRDLGDALSAAPVTTGEHGRQEPTAAPSFPTSPTSSAPPAKPKNSSQYIPFTDDSNDENESSFETASDDDGNQFYSGSDDNEEYFDSMDSSTFFQSQEQGAPVVPPAPGPVPPRRSANLQKHRTNPHAIRFRMNLMCLAGSITFLYEERHVKKHAFVHSIASQVALPPGAHREEEFHNLLPCAHLTCSFTKFSVEQSSSERTQKVQVIIETLNVLEYLVVPQNKKDARRHKSSKPAQKKAFVPNEILRFTAFKDSNVSPVGSPPISPRPGSYDQPPAPEFRPHFRCSYIHKELVSEQKHTGNPTSEGSDTTIHIALESACVFYDNKLLHRLQPLFDAVSTPEHILQRQQKSQEKKLTDQDILRSISEMSSFSASSRRIPGNSTHITIEINRALSAVVRFIDSKTGMPREEIVVLSFLDQRGPRLTSHIHAAQIQTTWMVEFDQFTASLVPKQGLDRHEFFEAHMRNTQNETTTPLEIIVRGDKWRPHHALPPGSMALGDDSLSMHDVSVYDEQEDPGDHSSCSFSDFFSLFKKQGYTAAEVDAMAFSKCVITLKFPSSRFDLCKADYDLLVHLFSSLSESPADKDLESTDSDSDSDSVDSDSDNGYSGVRRPLRPVASNKNDLALKVYCTQGTWVFSDDVPAQDGDNQIPKARQSPHRYELEFTKLHLFQLVGFQSLSQHYTVITCDQCTIHDTPSYSQTFPVVTKIHTGSDGMEENAMIKVLIATMPTEDAVKIMLGGFTIHHKKGLNWLNQLVAFFSPRPVNEAASTISRPTPKDKGKERAVVTDADDIDKKIAELKRIKKARALAARQANKKQKDSRRRSQSASQPAKASSTTVVATCIEIEYTPTSLSSKVALLIDKVVFRIGGTEQPEGRSTLRLKGLFVYILANSRFPSHWPRDVSQQVLERHPYIAQRMTFMAGLGFVQMGYLNCITADIVNNDNSVDKSAPATQIDVVSTDEPTLTFVACGDSVQALLDVFSEYSYDENAAAFPNVSHKTDEKLDILGGIDHNAYGPAMDKTRKPGKRQNARPSTVTGRGPTKGLVIRDDYFSPPTNSAKLVVKNDHLQSPAKREVAEASSSRPAVLDDTLASVSPAKAELKRSKGSTSSGAEGDVAMEWANDSPRNDDFDSEDDEPTSNFAKPNTLPTAPRVPGKPSGSDPYFSDEEQTPVLARKQLPTASTSTTTVKPPVKQSNQAQPPQVRTFFTEHGMRTLSEFIVENFTRLPQRTANDITLGVPEGHPRSSLRVVIHGLAVVVRLVDGFDMEPPPQSAPSSTVCSPASSFDAESIMRNPSPGSFFTSEPARPSRNEKISMEIHLDGVKVQFDEFEEGTQYARRVALTVVDFEIQDHIEGSIFREFLTYDSDFPRPTNTPMLGLAMECVRPDLRVKLFEEWRLRVKVLPLRLYVDSDALEFLAKFAMSFEENPSLPKAEQPIYFQHFAVESVRLKADYHPRPGLRAYTANPTGYPIPPFRGAALHFKPAKTKGTVAVVLARLMQAYLPTITSQSQLFELFSSVSPVRSLMNVASGVTDLIYTPYQQWRREGRVLKGIQQGGSSAFRKIGGELINAGTTVAASARFVFESADFYVGAGIGPTNLYQDQPQNTSEGMQSAVSTVSREFSHAARRLVVVPYDEYAKSGATASFGSFVTGVPQALLRPMIGVTDGFAKALIGATHYVDPALKQEMNTIYKKRPLQGALTDGHTSATQSRLSDTPTEPNGDAHPTHPHDSESNPPSPPQPHEHQQHEQQQQQQQQAEQGAAYYNNDTPLSDSDMGVSGHFTQ
eukprot:TRINITY_DN4738_c0_g1_i2.p1 TRINITY_DN4738_c0_g1~~TRINITY_DN4738_c0_g1_i2.p1  ORF type:complete len:2111 (-),score=286.45 TRINITY_DN4738_c0_g1_i2:26-6358(-)